MFSLLQSLTWAPSFNIGLNESHGVRGASYDTDTSEADNLNDQMAQGNVTRVQVSPHCPHENLSKGSKPFNGHTLQLWPLSLQCSHRRSHSGLSAPRLDPGLARSQFASTSGLVGSLLFFL